jgi:hypothetical protein
MTYAIGLTGACGIQDVIVDGVSRGPVTSYTFTNVLGNHTILATFSQGPFLIVASATPGGTINPNGGNGVACGGSITFNMSTNANGCPVDVRVDGVSLGPITSYTFANVHANHDISATFAQGPFAISASAGAGGSISPSGWSFVPCRGSQTYTIA